MAYQLSLMRIIKLTLFFLFFAVSFGAKAAATLVYPNNGMNISDTATVFVWDPVIAATSYTLQVSTDSSFNSFAINKPGLINNRDTVTGLVFGNKYYWRVTSLPGATSTIVGYFYFFNPTNAPDLSLWLKADGRVIKDAGNNVTNWVNEVNNNTDTVSQSTPTKRPVWTQNALCSKPMLKFDGTSQDLIGPASLQNIGSLSKTIFVVGATSSTSSAFYAKSLAAATANRYGLYYNGGSINGLLAEASGVSHSTIKTRVPGRMELFETVIDRVNLNNKLYVNDTLLNTATGVSASSYNNISTNRFLIGAYNNALDNGEQFFHKGYIGELVFYDQALSDSMRTMVSRYLFDKYSPPVNLGANHIRTKFCTDTIKTNACFAYYVWSTGAAGATVSSIPVTQSGTYKVTATDVFGRISYDSVQVFFPNPNYTGVPKICLGGTVLWDTKLDSAQYRFLWTGGSTKNYLVISNAGSYSVKVTDSLNCSYTSPSVAFTVDSFNRKVDLGPDVALCTNNLLGLQLGTNLATGYQWSTHDTTAQVVIDTAGRYKVTVTDIFGCTATDSINITIKGIGPIPNFSADTACSNAATKFTDRTTILSPYNIVSWAWTFGDNTSGTSQNPTHVYPAAGTYTATLIATANNTCSSSPISHTILVRPTVQALFTDSIACTGDSTRFFDKSVAGTGDSLTGWMWNFGGGSSSQMNTRYKFTVPGPNIVSLIASTRYGCSDTFTRSVRVDTASGATGPISLVLPLSGANIINAVDTFTWLASTNAVRYVLQIATNPTFSSIVYSHEVYSLKDSVGNLPFTTNTYYWRVTAYNLCGSSTTSATNTFTRFRPSLIGNISFWIMGDGLVTKTSANRVTEWKDNGSTALSVKQANTVVAPLWVDNVTALNHKPIVRFDGTDYLSGGNILNIGYKDRTMFVVGRSLSATGAYLAKSLAAAALNRYAIYWSAGFLNLLYNDSQQFLDSVVPKPTFGSYEMVSSVINRNTGNLSIQRNTANTSGFGGIQGNNYDMSSTNRFLVGAYNNATDVDQVLYLNGDIAEVILFDSVLTTTDYSNVQRYLLYKYGGGPVSLGPDVNIEYGFCKNVVLNASDRYVKYRWSTGDTTHSSITITAAGTYSVTVTDVFDQVYSDTIIVNKPGVALPPATVFCLGDSLKWDVNLGTAYRYKFSNNATTPFLNVVNPGTYSVTITDTIPPAQGGPCSITKTVVFVQDSFKVKASLGRDTTLCRGQYIGLRRQAAQAVSYLWSDGSADSTLVIRAAGSYSLTASSINNCIAKDTVLVNVSGQIADVAFTNSASYCIGDTVHFENLTTIGAPFQITGYQWLFGDAQTAITSSADHYYDTIGTYNVTLTVAADSGCVSSVTKPVRINPLPVAKFTHSIGCANALVNFTDQSTATLADPIRTWVWTFGDGTQPDSSRNPLHSFAAAGKYPISLTVYTLIGCPKTIYDTIEIYPELKAAIGAEHLCKGQTVQFHDNSESVSNIKWTWQFPDNTYSNDSNPLKSFSPTGDYVITLTITNAVGCINSATDTITIFDPPTADFNTVDHCVQFPYAFADNITSIAGDSIQSRIWNFGDTTGTSIKRRPQHQYADSGTYNVTLKITTEHGCQDSIVKPLHIIGKPNAAFSFTPNYGGSPLFVTFTNRSTGGDSYAWDFGDGTFSTDFNTTHTYTQNGKYTIQLIVSNSVGCSDTTTDTLNVIPASLDLLIDTFVVSMDSANSWTMTAFIINIGSRAVNYFDIYASLGSGNTIVERVTDTIAAGGTLNYTFKAHYFLTVPDDATYLCVETRNPDGEADENMANNNKCAALKKDIRLILPYPNPATTTLSFGAVMAAKGDVTITLYDATGANLGTLYDGEAAKGTNKWSIDTQMMRSGGYFIRIKYKEDTQTMKFVITH